MKSVRIFNRYRKVLEVESICGEWFLRLAYGNIIGRFLQRFFLSLPFFSHLAGLYARSRRSRLKILPFVKRHSIDIGESVVPVDQFNSFNDFFCRTIKTTCRPIEGDRDAIVAPVDGRYFYIPHLRDQRRITIKGQRLDLQSLVGSERLAQKFADGSAIIARLSPMDYHRFHFPFDGIPGSARLIQGRLQSVHRLALAKCQPFHRNKRFITRIVTTIGEILMIEVGSTFIGSVHQTYTPHRHVKKGMEKGYFSFGGSTVILIFESLRLRPSSDLLEQSSLGFEIFIRMGDGILRRQ